MRSWTLIFRTHSLEFRAGGGVSLPIAAPARTGSAAVRPRFRRRLSSRMARAYAFQVYGIDSSRTAMEQLAPMFGRRLKQQRLGDLQLPGVHLTSSS